MSDYKSSIERGLILWLREEHGITAVSAEIGESEIERGWRGCETCDYGGQPDEVYTPVYYKTSKDTYELSVRVEGTTSIGFLPTLLEYIERAN